MANALQKLRKLINPEQLQQTGEVRSRMSQGVYRVQPLGQDVGFIVCRSSETLSTGDRVYFKGNVILGKSPTTGSLTFVEV